MDNPGDKIPLHPRGRDIVLGVALKTTNTQIDESRKFIDSLYQKANETRKKLKGSHATFSFLEILKSNQSDNINTDSSNLPELTEFGGNFHSLQYYKYIDVSAEQALQILETGFDQVHLDYSQEEMEEYIKLLLKPLVSEGSLKRLEKLKNKISSCILDISNDKETESKNLKYNNLQNDTTVSLMTMFLLRMQSFQKCLPVIIDVIDPLIMVFREWK